MEGREVVAALRCSSQAPTLSPPCATCAYRVVELLDGKEYTSCDCDRIGMDAADKIEELVERCARYAEEIAMLREKQRWVDAKERQPEYGVQAEDVTVKWWRSMVGSPEDGGGEHEV